MSLRNPKPDEKALGLTVAFTLAVAAVLGVMSQVLPRERVVECFSEAGPFEEMSVWLWAALAVASPLVLRRRTLGVVCGSVVCLFAAARESDWHNAHTDYSVLKPAFYLSSRHHLHHQIMGGLLVALLLACGVVMLHRIWRLAWGERWRFSAWVWGAGFASGVLVFSKTLDRLPAILRKDVEVTVPEWLLSLGIAYEEGLESFLPVVILGVIVTYARRGPERHGSDPEPEAAAPA